MTDNTLQPLDLEGTRDNLASWDEYINRCQLDDGAVPASDARAVWSIAAHLVEHLDTTANLDVDNLGEQVASVRHLLSTLARRVREVTEVADEQDRPDVVDALSDTLLHLNDAAAQLADVIA